MNQPKVSIIVPIYNVEKYLDRCMQSLMHQTLKDIEIILVDDGSPDNCPAMCDEYAKQDNRIKVIHKQNAGLGMARNSGIEIATGEYIAFIDSDDYTEVNAYEKLYNASDKGHYDIVYSGFYQEQNDGTFKAAELIDQIYNTEESIIELLGEMISSDVHVRKYRLINMAVWRSIYKASIIKQNNVKFESERVILSEDIVFDTVLIPLCKNIRFIPQAFTHYCINESSLTHTFHKDKLQRIYNLYNALERNIKLTGHYNFLHQRTLRLFIDYYEAFCREIDLSGISFQEKKKLCEEVYNLPEWEKVKNEYISKGGPILNKIKYKLLIGSNFLLQYTFNKILNVVR